MDVITRQRQELCALLDSLSDQQWTAETMCAGWDAGDIVAHLLVREREPIAAIGILAPPMSWLTDKRQATRKAKGRERLMADLKAGPPPWMRLPIVGDVQVGEDWIHMMDVARGGAATADGPTLPTFDGTEDPEVARLLWKAIGRFAPITLRSIAADGVVSLTDGTTRRTYRVGGPMTRLAIGEKPDVTVTGPVGELVLFATGRTQADVAIEGTDPLRAAVTDTKRRV